MGVLQILNTGCPIRIVETLNVERVEGIDVESKLDPFTDRECLVDRQVGDVDERPGQHRMRERIYALGAGRIAGRHRGAVLQRDHHVIVPEILRARRVVDRRLIGNVIGGKAHYSLSCVDQVRRDVTVEPHISISADAAAAIGDRNFVLIEFDIAGWSPVSRVDLEGLREDVSDERHLVSSEDRIHDAPGIPQQWFPFAEGQVDDSVEADVMFRDIGILVIVLPAIELIARMFYYYSCRYP